MKTNITPQVVQWFQVHDRLLKDGGYWVNTQTGSVWQKNGTTYTLTQASKPHNDTRDALHLRAAGFQVFMQ